MKCQPRSLTPFLDGELTQDAWHELDEHLQSCPDCSAQLDELTAASQQVSLMGRAEIPDNSLNSALEMIAGRAGISPMTAMDETTEIAEAQPVEPDAADQAWNPGKTSIKQLPEIGIPEDVYWDQPRATSGSKVEPSEAVEADQVAEPMDEDVPEAAPTWVEPERWHPGGQAETGALAFVRAPGSEGETPEVDLAATEPVEEHSEAAIAKEDLDVDLAATEPLEEHSDPAPADQDAEPELGAAGLETPPSPPPAQLLPAWMEIPPLSDAELEAAGRAALEDAIGPPDTPVRKWAGLVDMPSQTGDAGAAPLADAALPITVGPDPPGDQDPTVNAEARQRSWFAALLAFPFERRGSQPTEDSAVAAVDRGNADPTVSETTVDTESEPEGTGVEETTAGVMAARTTADAPGDQTARRGYRGALMWARTKPAGARTKLLSSPELQVRVGLGAALVVILVAGGMLLSSRNTHPPSTAVAQPNTSHGSASRSTIRPTPSVRPTISASPVIGAAPGALSEVVRAGSGGTGWAVARIRLGSPGNGITRVVLDLEGTGSTPTAQLGRSSDGSIYLSVPELSISPSALSGLTPSGSLKAITRIGGSGTNLRFNPNGTPGFSIGYLAGPNRLVLDFK